MADKIKVKSNFDKKGNYEPSDSEDEYTPNEKRLLEKVRKRKHNDSESEEEVYGFSESGDSENEKEDLDIADSDVEGQEQSDDDLPDSKAWGKKKRSYYATDYVDEDYGGFGNDEEIALMEEKEAKDIQKRLLEQLGEEDFTLDFLTKQVADVAEKETVIKTDLSKMSKRQKLELLEKESPEFAGLIDDFKTKLTVAKDDLHPVLELVKDGKLPTCPASKFVKTNYDLILNYCTNISFYVLLKSQRINIQNHPVIKRLYQYRQMLNKMEPIYLEVIKPQIDKILQALRNNLELHVTEMKELRKDKKRKSERQSPAITVIDPLDNVRILLNRYCYYTILKDEPSLNKQGIFTPSFAEFTTTNIEMNIEIMRQRGVKFPVICKPTIAHGSKSAHEMIVIFNEKGLHVCKPPCVVQSFVNHNAVLHKVFLIGDRYHICERPSLKNFYASEDLEPIYYSTGEVCKADSQSTLSILDPHDNTDITMTLNEDKIKTIIRILKKRIGLLLAGFDVVIDNVTGGHAVIDINVYPSYDNFPNFFEHLLDTIEEAESRNLNKVYTNGDCNGAYEEECLGHKKNGLINVGMDPIKFGVTGMNIN